MVRVKICGITNLTDAQAACRLGADAIGFIFTESPRRVNAAKVRAISAKLPPYVTTVGVFADEKMSNVLRMAKKCRLDCLQLHGDEPPDYCRKLKKYYKIIKVIRVKDAGSINEARSTDADAFLLDAYISGKKGGTGTVFDWKLVSRAKRLGKPVILSGGLNPGNIRKAVKRSRPYAVDVSSGVETRPGKKDIMLMGDFIRKVRSDNSGKE